MALSAGTRVVRERLVWAGIAAFGAAALAFGFLLLHREKPVPAPVRFTVDTPQNGSLPLFGRPSVSPDGQSVLFAVTDPASRSTVWYLHSLATGISRALPGAESTTAIYWAFDSRSILLSRSNAFWKMDLNSASPQRLPITGAFTSWQREGIVTGGRPGLRWFRPDGSGLRWVKKRDGEKGIGYSYPSLIPGGRWLTYNAAEGEGVAATGFSLHLASLDGKVDRQLLTAEHAAVYAGPGYLLYRRGDTLMAQAIDPKNGDLRGGPSPIANSIATTVGIVDQLGSFSASDNGVLVFRRGAAIAQNRLLWFDRTGKSLGAVGEIADYSGPALSPGGDRLAIGIRDPETGRRDFWILDLHHDTKSRVTPDPADDSDAAWSPDGTRLAFTSNRGGTHERQNQPSPDGRWMAYQSNETGRSEVFVRQVTTAGGKWQISKDGGGEPQWRGDGKELFYTTLQDPARIMAVDIADRNGAMQAGIPHPLFDVRLPAGTLRNRFAATRDGKKFLAIVPPEQKAANSFTVIVNWPSLLKK